jgi:hypothetical protein
MGGAIAFWVFSRFLNLSVFEIAMRPRPRLSFYRFALVGGCVRCDGKERASDV